MAPGDGLRWLQVGITRHGRIQVFLRADQQRVLQADNMLTQTVAGAHYPQAKIGRDLVVTAAPGVQFAA